MLLIVILRGHIRDSLTNQKLFNFLKLLDSRYNLLVHLHTWDVSQSSQSWRKLNSQEYCVTDFMIQKYFDPLNFTFYIESDNTFHENFNAYSGTVNIGKTTMPMKAYYQYIYNLFKSFASFENIFNGRESDIKLKDCMCISMRVDFFANCNVCNFNTYEDLFEKISRDIERKIKASHENHVTFLSESVGCDNYIQSTYHVLFKSFKNLFEQYASIIGENKDVRHQELILKKEMKGSKYFSLYPNILPIRYGEDWIYLSIKKIFIIMFLLNCMIFIRYNCHRRKKIDKTFY